MRSSSLYASLALLLLPALPVVAAEKTPTPVRATEPPTPVSNASTDAAGDGTAAVSGAKGIVLGFNQLPTVGGFLHLTPVDTLRLNLGFALNFKPDFGAQFGLDVNFRHHLTTGTLRPYLEGGIQFGYAGDISFAAKGGAGAEYFLVPRVSVSGTLGLALRFDSGGNSISLPVGTTAVLLNVYL